MISLTYANPQPDANSLNLVSSPTLGVKDGIEALLNGSVIKVNNYADNLSKDAYIRYNYGTQIAYNLYTDGTLDYWVPYDIPINVFLNYDCQVYNQGLDILPNNTDISYTSPDGNNDLAFITNAYTDSNNNIYYTISRDIGYYQL